MKNIGFCFLFALSLLLVGCGDDSGECVSQDYTGIWSGTAECEGEDPESTTVEIRAGNSADEIIVDDGETEYVLEIEGCNIVIEEQTIDLLGFEVSIEGDGELDGDVLTINQTVNFIGIEQDCTVVLTR